MEEGSLGYHEMQARLGASSAHPGGFQTTLDMVEYIGVRPGTRVLEVGCGTGRTACLLAKKGAKVTGLDRNPKMLTKARTRAEAEGATVEWVQGDLRRLPFESERYELVLAESVTVFNPISEAVAEYLRVLVPGGRVVDLEMSALPGLTPRGQQDLTGFYGALRVPTYAEWETAYSAAGFDQVSLWRKTRVDLIARKRRDDMLPDPYQVVDEGAMDDPRVTSLLMENSVIMAQYSHFLGYAGITGFRPAR